MVKELERERESGVRNVLQNTFEVQVLSQRTIHEICIKRTLGRAGGEIPEREREREVKRH